MEKRAALPLLFGGAGLALAVAIGILVVKVRAAPPAPSVSPGESVRSHVAAERPPAAESRPHAPAALQSSAPEEPAAEPAPDNPAAIADRMTEANRLYDRGDYEEARQVAKEVLMAQPQNVKMLRIGASSACILGDGNEARVYYDQLPESDQQQIARRCRRYGIEF